MLARCLGIDIERFPECSSDYRMVRLLLRSGIDVVLDIGANGGQYGAILRRFGYRGRIASFEPLRGPLENLHRLAVRDPLWSVFPYALGDRNAVVTLNVAGNDGASSSILPMLPRTIQACPEARYVGRQEAEQRRLDEVWPQVVGPKERVFLKLDVQGYEEPVLLGGGDFIRRCHGMQIEVSSVALYDGGLLIDRALELAQRRYGFTLMTLAPCFSDQRTGQVLQYDAVFMPDPSTCKEEAAHL
ncbi:FkbM family methyltransferase [Streptomyces sp. NPDC059373]